MNGGGAESRKALTLGLVLGVSVMAIATLAVVTIAPLIAAELGGLEHYGWLFSANLLASLIGTVWGGAQADRHGPGRAFLLGLGAFVLGSALAALATTMAVVIAARALQGLGSGAVITCIYVAVSLAYPDRARARIMAFLSSAWVLPALLGPAAAGMLAELASWRWVFAALVPLASLVAVLSVPSFLSFRKPPTARTADHGPLLRAALLALAVGSGLWSLGATSAPVWARALALALAFGVAPPTLARLMPPRTLRLAPGLASVVSARGLLFAGFITVEVYLALMLTGLLGLSSAVTGLVIATGALVWTLGSWAQARLDGAPEEGLPALLRPLCRQRELRVRLGVQVLATGLALQLLALALPTGAALAVALAGWSAAGVGIGFAHSGSSVLAFERAELEGVEPGAVSAALQLADGVSAATSTGVAGALLALVVGQTGLALGLAAAYGVGVVAVGLSLLAAARIGPRPARSSPAVA